MDDEIVTHATNDGNPGDNATERADRVARALHRLDPSAAATRADDTTVEPWRDRLRVDDATADAIWDLPVIGSVDAPAAALIRPDGHVAWTATADEEPLDVVLTRWCGAQPRT